MVLGIGPAANSPGPRPDRLPQPADMIARRPGSPRLLPVTAALLGLVTFGITVAVTVLIARAYGAQDALWAAAWLTPPLVGGLAAARRPRNAVGWLLLVIGAMGALSQAGYAYSPGPRPSVPQALILAMGSALLFLALLRVTLLVAVFPEGRLPRGARRKVIQIAAIAYLVLPAVGFVTPTLSGDARSYPNPLALPELDGLINGLFKGFMVGALILVLVAAGDAVRRQRQARGVQGQQFKWLAYASVLLFPALIVAVAPSGNSWWGALPLVISINGLAASIGLAIVRYRLYDIDRIVSRTISYLIVVGLLFGVYVASVLLMTTVLPLRGSVSVVIAVLIAAGLFAPVRSRARAVVNRRFNRSRYNAQAVVEAFTGRLGEQVSLDSISSDLLAAVSQTVQPSHATLWLRGPAARERGRPVVEPNAVHSAGEPRPLRPTS